MRQRLLTFSALFLLIFLLVGLNAVSYVRKNIEPDSEFNPNRSTYNAGATGTRAFYDLLSETGRKPLRWQEKFSALETESKNKPQTFVVIGSLKKGFTKDETEQLLRWVKNGGRLVVIDRAPNPKLIATTAKWKVSSTANNFPSIQTDPSDQKQMTDKVPAAVPAQPTIFTQNVNAVQPSQFASAIKLEKISGNEISADAIESEDYDDKNESLSTAAPPENKNGGGDPHILKPSPVKPVIASEKKADAPIASADEFRAPVVHVSADGKNLLADFPYGAGRIVFLSDPYVVSNAGIGLVDNAQTAINIVNADGGTIAFDELHQGFGATQNQLSNYFAETPVPAMFAQIVLLVGLLFLTQSRRFARPLPADEASRLSKLEYVSAMAELQQRAKAYDLAIENIYTDFRRRTAKFFGADNYTITRRELAALIAGRLKLSADDIENLMRKAEEITYGEPTNKREVLEITTRLRELEEKLNLKRTRRQTFGR